MPENIMKQIKVEKLTLNIGAGKDSQKMEKGTKLIKLVSGVDPVKTKTNKRIPGWGLRPGLPIGAKITLRGEAAVELLKRLLVAKDSGLKDTCFDDHGNVSFGIPEYIDIPGIEYDPDVGIMGLQVSVTLTRPGYRVAKRRIRPGSIGKVHKINKKDAVEFIQSSFNIKVRSKDDNQ